MRHVTRLILAFCGAGVSGFHRSSLAQKRPLNVDDIYNLKDVRDPQRSPDGKWVAYVVARAIKDTDKNDSDVWMASWDGTQEIQLTSSPDSESQPRWSPDNKYLAFVSSRQGAKDGQLWLMNRAGGEAIKADRRQGRRLRFRLVARQQAHRARRERARSPRSARRGRQGEPEKKKTAPPIVIDRYHFKQDVYGYLRNERTHLYLFDVATKKAEVLTPGSFRRRVAGLVARRHADRVRQQARHRRPRSPRQHRHLRRSTRRSGAQPRQLTTSPMSDGGGRVAWSPDGKQIAYLAGEELKYSAYNQEKLAVIPAAGGQPRLLAESLDRPIRQRWSRRRQRADVRRRRRSLAVSGAGDAEQRARSNGSSRGARVISQSVAATPTARCAVLASTDTEPPRSPRSRTGSCAVCRTRTTRGSRSSCSGRPRSSRSTSKDGTEVHGLIVKPATYVQGQKYPTLLRIHGGPNGQDEHAFSFERELFAANGYVVVAVNYRGSNGRGSAYQKAIFADWGNKEVVDLLGAMDHVAEDGRRGPRSPRHRRLELRRDPHRLHDRDRRPLQGGRPAAPAARCSCRCTAWTSTSRSTRTRSGRRGSHRICGSRFRIRSSTRTGSQTPTLFLGGDKDFNVPLVGGEQMYQALRSLGVDTQLVIYPDQFHGITMPTYKIDRLPALRGVVRQVPEEARAEP